MQKFEKYNYHQNKKGTLKSSSQWYLIEAEDLGCGQPCIWNLSASWDPKALRIIGLRSQVGKYPPFLSASHPPPLCNHPFCNHYSK